MSLKKSGSLKNSGSLKKSLTGHPVGAGLALLALAGIAVLLVFNKPALLNRLTPGEIIVVQMARDYKLHPYLSAVKIAGSKIGVVRSVERPDSGPILMTLKVDNGTRKLLGTEPSAVVQPTTLLGGTYFVQLHPGGQPGTAATNVIPIERSGLPVELQQILAALPPESQQGNQVALAKLDEAFKPGGVGPPLHKLLADAPSGLRPTGVVVDALRGVDKDADLSNLITDLNTTARTLSAKPGQLRSLVDSMGATAKTFGDNAVPFDRTIATLPETMRVSRDGAGHLGRLLDKLTTTADDARPTVKELDPMLDELEPALTELRPVLSDLKPLLKDAEPMLERLTPAVRKTTDVVDDLDSPVLDRLNGPILDAFLSEFKGVGPKYPNGGEPGTKLYEQLGWLVSNVSAATQPFQADNHHLSVWLGGGPTALQGTGPMAQRIQDLLSEGYGPPHHKPTTPIGPQLPGGVKLPLPDKPAPALPEPKLGNPLTNLGVGK